MAAAARVTNLGIGYGRCYVEGILCENEPPGECEAPEDDVTYFNQPYYFRDPDDNAQQLPSPPFLVYLDVWERHITSLEDDSIREVALLGPDTSTRSQVVWQVRAWPLQATVADCGSLPWGDLVEEWRPANRGCLAAQSKPGDTSTDACILPPESRFRGFENQLYRVEIHDPGPVQTPGATGQATFKWSRNNGSVVFPVEGEVSGKVVTLEKGDWVEIVDDHYELDGRAEPLLKVAYVDRASRQVTLEGELPAGVGDDAALHPLLRRWDQKASGGTALNPDGTISVVEGKWLDLEDQVQIRFEAGGNYQTGDYWQIPARVATGDVIWPRKLDAGKWVPLPRPPKGVTHYFAPLAIVNGLVDAELLSCRKPIGT
jgi:hypothetical protein